jgi:hypothetical protein
MRLRIAALALLLVAAQGTCRPVEDEPAIVYGLTDDSEIAKGCFPPLACPAVAGQDLGGTFEIRRIATSDSADVYTVRHVYWLARIAGQDIRITGSGLYIDGVDEDQMRLDLRVGDEPVERFDSGPVPSGPPAEDGIDITISIHGGTYVDTVIDIRALPFRPPANGTPCGPDGLTCDPATEVCVAKTPVGPAIVYACVPVPEGCEDDRSCDCAGVALCESPYDVCSEMGDNQLQCECPLCQ